jgi:hypothetical protein
MIDRRQFLLSASTLALFTYVPVAAEANNGRMDKTAALGLLESKVRASIAWAEQTGEKEWLEKHYAAFFKRWDQEHTRLDKKILDDLPLVYRDSYFKDLKERGHKLFNTEGRMWPTAQAVLTWYFPILPSECNPEVFEAFATFAPAELV